MYSKDELNSIQEDNLDLQAYWDELDAYWEAQPEEQ